MSIASELQDLETNVAAIQQAIIDKGGSVTGGLADLATDIEQMPSGGANDPITKYGYIYYHPHTTAYIGTTWGEELTINSIDQTKYASWLSSNGFDLDNEVSFRYESGGWLASQWSPSMVEVNLTESELLTAAGISVTITSYEMAQFQVKKSAVIDETTTSELEIASLADYQALVNPNATSDYIAHLSNTDICFSGVIRFVFGADVTSVPNDFLRKSSIETISALPKGITSIGNDFLDYCAKFNGDIDLNNVTTVGNRFLGAAYAFTGTVSCPAVKTIGDEFMDGCSKFNGSLSMDVVESIGHHFLNNCTAFNQPITIPNTVQSIGKTGYQTYFMRDCQSMVSTITVEASSSVFPTSQYADSYSLGARSNTAPCYTTGITLTGTYANDWKTFFPDGSYPAASTYRKLIVASS